MRFLHYKEGGDIRLAVKTQDGVFDIKRLSPSLPATLNELMAGGEDALAAVKSALKEDAANAARVDGKIEFAPAVPSPGKILCIGLNYYAHGKEINMKIPETPTVFSKFNNSLAAHGEDIRLPQSAYKFDYEVELVAIIGKGGRDIPVERALSHVFGYTAGNDVSARDLQMLTGQWLLGKSCDGFAPIGPCIVTADEIGDPQKLDIECRVNGETVQSSNTGNMIFDCAFLISYISRYMTLEPGDIIFTGTPSGVILGKSESEQRWLCSGDEIETVIEKIGCLKNRLI